MKKQLWMTLLIGLLTISSTVFAAGKVKSKDTLVEYITTATIYSAQDIEFKINEGYLRGNLEVFYKDESIGMYVPKDPLYRTKAATEIKNSLEKYIEEKPLSMLYIERSPNPKLIKTIKVLNVAN